MPRDLGRTLQRTLSHLLPPPVKGGKFGAPIPTHFRPNAKFVQPKDRIAYWNIAPGDRVKLIRGPADLKGSVGTVERVDRETSRIYLSENQFCAKKRQMNQYPGEAFTKAHSPEAVVFVPRAFHVDNFRLQLREGKEEHTVTRIKRTKVHWDRGLRRFSWKRFGLIKALIDVEGKDDGWRQISWPKEANRDKQSPGVLDTIKAESSAQTFFPSLATLSLHAIPVPTAAGTKKTLAKPITELSLPALDFTGGYFSRASRTKRFNLQKAEKLVYTKQERKDDRKQAAMKKVAGRAEVELA